MVLVEDREGTLERWGLFFNQQEFSDIEVQVLLGEDNPEHENDTAATFYCHKIVLAAASPVFKKMLSAAMKEGLEGKVVVKELDPRAVEWLLRVFYTGKGDLTDDLVVHVMMAAKMYDVGWVEMACRLYLRNHVNEDNCCLIFDQIIRTQNHALQERWGRFVHGQIIKICEGQHFLELSLKAVLQLAVYTKDEDTYDFCRAVVKWLGHEDGSRLEHGCEIFRELDLLALTIEELNELMKLDIIQELETVPHDIRNVLKAYSKHGDIHGSGKGNVGTMLEYSTEKEEWQDWTVPRSAWYHIVAMGAKAADGNTHKGGKGAIIGASFMLESGDALRILTGGMSKLYPDQQYSGGAGGSFVIHNESLLLAAGGGGGCGNSSSGTDGNLEENGSIGPANLAGGKAGNNGTSSGEHLGGKGYMEDRDSLDDAVFEHSLIQMNCGGFGGGGDVCGGGGGYSGGGAGNGTNGGGGGGSFVSAEADHVWKKVGNSGDGRVSIWSSVEKPNTKEFLQWVLEAY